MNIDDTGIVSELLALLRSELIAMHSERANATAELLMQFPFVLILNVV